MRREVRTKCGYAKCVVRSSVFGCGLILSRSRLVETPCSERSKRKWNGRNGKSAFALWGELKLGADFVI